MKIQPVDCSDSDAPGGPARIGQSVKPVVKSRLKRIFELQFLRDKVCGVVDPINVSNRESEASELEPSSLCLDKMVQSFIEEGNDRQPMIVKCGRNRRNNCFNGNCTDSSDDEFDTSSEAFDVLKTLVPCSSVCERNLLADVSKIIDKNKISKRKDGFSLEVVANGLLALGYDASICKSRWEKSISSPAGEYDYIDVIVSEERLLVDIDFRSEFEIARSTKSYMSLLQTLPYIFVGGTDRLGKIVSVVSEAAKQSLKKKGMHVPPWRKPDYVKAKWLSPYIRTSTNHILLPDHPKHERDTTEADNAAGFGASVFGLPLESPVEEQKVKEWRLPVSKPKSLQIGAAAKVVTGLASVIADEL